MTERKDTGGRIVPAEEGMAEAAVRLRAGQLVAFPTETVYGLGADARDPEAVARIFAAKGRPATNPVIVHVADAERARALAGDWPETAAKLAERFWPGPLTLVVPKTDAVPDVVTAGGGTVGLRVPNHPVALELLRLSGVPVAAPSANRSEEVSPTLARHVADSLGPYVDDLLVLDGGPCEVGLESTVLDVTGDLPRILRPGGVTKAMLKAVVGEVTDGAFGGGPARSPGQMPRHYAPRAAVVLLAPTEIIHFPYQPTDALLWRTVWPGSTIARTTDPALLPNVCMSRYAALYGAQLYDALRRMDAAAGVTRILVEKPPAGDAWKAVHDRLRRAVVPAGEGCLPPEQNRVGGHPPPALRATPSLASEGEGKRQGKQIPRVPQAPLSRGGRGAMTKLRFVSGGEGRGDAGCTEGEH